MFAFPQLAWLEAFRNRVNTDPEMKLIGRWFSTSISLSFGDTRYVLRVDQGCIGDIVANPRIDARAAFGFRAPVEVWWKFLSATPPPLYHDFFAMLMRVPEFVIEGDSFLAMQNARAPSDDEILCAARRSAVAEFEPIVGRYLPVRFDGVDYRIFVEEAGGGVPLLCLHTAGADSRQFRHVLNDADVTRQFRVMAFDFPWHGRSNPPANWWLMRYRLTTKTY